jgi:uncharacterized Zn finger protein
MKSKIIYCKICEEDTKHEVILDEFDDINIKCTKCGLWSENGEEQ